MENEIIKTENQQPPQTLNDNAKIVAEAMAGACQIRER